MCAIKTKGACHKFPPANIDGLPIRIRVFLTSTRPVPLPALTGVQGRSLALHHHPHPKKENTMTTTRNTTPTTARLHRIKQGQEKLLTMRQQRQETLERMKDPTLGGIVDRSVTF